MDLTHEAPTELDAAAETTPAAPGVVLLEPAVGSAYLARTNNLKRRVLRVLRSVAGRGEIRSLRYQPVGSAFEGSLLLQRIGRRIWPKEYRRRLRLRPAHLLKVHLSNEFPRTSVTTRLSKGRALHYGPFRNRATAERFEEAALDLFTVRRCVENLAPSADHPGCIYGEMGKCSRPCQAAVEAAEYQAEVGRLLRALETRGESIVERLEQARDQASEDLDFEAAARAHEKLRAVRDAFQRIDDLARDLDALHGVVVQSAAEPDAVLVWPLYKGFFQDPIRTELRLDAARHTPLDRRLREAFEGAEFQTGDVASREDHLALLTRWRSSSWSRGELTLFDGWDRIPYRRVVNAISRVARGKS